MNFQPEYKGTFTSITMQDFNPIPERPEKFHIKETEVTKDKAKL